MILQKPRRCQILSQKYGIPFRGLGCLCCRLTQQSGGVSGSWKGFTLGVTGGELLDAFGWQSAYDRRVCECTGAGQRNTEQNQL